MPWSKTKKTGGRCLGRQKPCKHVPGMPASEQCKGTDYRIPPTGEFGTSIFVSRRRNWQRAGYSLISVYFAKEDRGRKVLSNLRIKKGEHHNETVCVVDELGFVRRCSYVDDQVNFAAAESSQLQAATAAHPHLKAIFPMNYEFDAYPLRVPGGIAPAKSTVPTFRAK
jgi:hypothetical protein